MWTLGTTRISRYWLSLTTNFYHMSLGQTSRLWTLHALHSKLSFHFLARYRAPEVLLQSLYYSASVDMWAMGTIMVELFTFQPLFPGASELDQIYKICSVIGSPNYQTWPEELRLAASMSYQCPQFKIYQYFIFNTSWKCRSH